MNLREFSRKEYGSNTSIPSCPELQVGALQRIADAAEMMAKSNADLLAQKMYYMNLAAEREHEIEYLKLRIRSLRGQVTKARKSTLVEKG
jgi:hypothetical protein